MTIDTDKEMIERFLGGDEDAFAEILDRYIKPIYGFLYQLTNDAEAANDLTQETFIKVWKNIRRFDNSKKMKTWIFSIAKNTAFDFMKKKKTLPFSSFEDEEGNISLEEISDDNMLPDEILERKDLALELDKNLRKISKDYQVILVMRYRDDFTLAEIAEILGRPYSTVKSQHLRAISALKKAFLGN